MKFIFYKLTHNFLWGVIATILGIVIFMLMRPIISSFIGNWQTSGWLEKVPSSLDAISIKAIKQASLENAGRGVTLPYGAGNQDSVQMEVTDESIVLVRGGYEGQLIALIPTLAATTVSWRCLGGSAKVTVACTKFSYTYKAK
jgi:hypothetical protein